jgi:HTH-type transcriptional regulator, sugar sensing transcriptional regulator
MVLFYEIKLTKSINNMKNVEKKLKKFGFSEKEASIYIAILELGEASASNIANKSGQNRTTTYSILSQLVREGVVKKTKKKTKTFFFVEDVNNLNDSLKQKKRVLNDLLPELSALHNILPSKPKITFYEGEGGMRDFYLHILDTLLPGDFIYEYFGSNNLENIMSEEFAYFYFHERTKRKIPIKIIATESSFSKRMKDEQEKFLREVKFVKDNDFTANMQIFKRGVGIISYKDDFMGVIIESVDVYKMMKMSFDLAWQGIE